MLIFVLMLLVVLILLFVLIHIVSADPRADINVDVCADESNHLSVLILIPLLMRRKKKVLMVEILWSLKKSIKTKFTSILLRSGFHPRLFHSCRQFKEIQILSIISLLKDKSHPS